MVSRKLRNLLSMVAAMSSVMSASYATGDGESQALGAKRHASKIEIFGLYAASQLGEVVVGGGLNEISNAGNAITGSGGSVLWVKFRDKVDNGGMRHVFYRQLYRPPIGSVAASSASAASGAWLVGAEIGLHYDPEGTLVYVFGTQYEDVVATTTPVIGNASDAARATDQAVRVWPGFSADNSIGRTLEKVEFQLSNAALLMHSTGKGGSFNYVWRVPTWDASGLMYLAILDANTGDLVSLDEAVAWSECSPNSNDQDSAIGIPQNSSIDDRGVWATETDDRGVTYTHEAHKISSGSNPSIEILMGMNGDGCDDMDYALMPLRTISGYPTYDDYDDIPGSSGGDAIYFTYLTMATFDENGWDSWDDSGSDAVVVVDSDCGGVTDNAAMINSGPYDWAPTPSVAVCSNSTQPYESSAAIDSIAHEWGHGVIFSSANWSRSTFAGKVYHEGWADIIGHYVEHDSQTPGSEAEEADWRFGEDRGTQWRRADTDDGSSGYSIHADDPPGDTSSEHDTGNRLGTAYYLMSEGGYNPVCTRLPNADGCDVDVSEVGSLVAGRTLFKALTSYATSSSDWDDFGSLAKIAAYFLFKSCPGDNAEEEQQAAVDSFEAIGYDPGACCLPCLP